MFTNRENIMMIQNFDTIEEAKKMAAAYLLADSKTFCPLAGDICVLECVCYQEPKVFEHKYNTKYHIDRGGCKNKMLIS